MGWFNKKKKAKAPEKQNEDTRKVHSIDPSDLDGDGVKDQSEPQDELPREWFTDSPDDPGNNPSNR